MSAAKDKFHEYVYRLIMVHLGIFDVISDLTNRALMALSENNLESMMYDLQNKDRLINILSEVQAEIEDLIETTAQENIDSEFVNIIKTWSNDLNLNLEKISHLDMELTDALNNAKDETSKELASIFRSFEQFKGYNLSTTKK